MFVFCLATAGFNALWVGGSQFYSWYYDSSAVAMEAGRQIRGVYQEGKETVAKSWEATVGGVERMGMSATMVLWGVVGVLGAYAIAKNV